MIALVVLSYYQQTEAVCRGTTALMVSDQRHGRPLYTEVALAVLSTPSGCMDKLVSLVAGENPPL